MDPHTATEVAYKNGYAAGKADTIKEVSEEIERIFAKYRYYAATSEEFVLAFSELRVKYAELSGK